jgi:hypothetical protein
MSKFSSTKYPDPFALAGRNEEIATDSAPNRASDHASAGVGMAAQPGDIPAAVPPRRSDTMPDGNSIAAIASEDPVLALLPLLAEADALGKEGDDDAVDRFIDIQGELARVTAISLPGLCAHLEQFQRLAKEFDEGTGGGAALVAAKHASAIEKGLAEGVTAATLPTLQEHLEQLGELLEGFVDDGTCSKWFDSIVEGFETLVESRFANEPIIASADHSGDEGDTLILGLFREWQAAWLAAGTNIGPDGVDDGNVNPEAMDRAEQLEKRIWEAPAEGAVGMGIKAYMLAFSELGAAEGPFALDGFDPDDYGARLYDHRVWLKSLIEDATRFCPELVPLTANIVAAPIELPLEADRNAEPVEEQEEKTAADDATSTGKFADDEAAQNALPGVPAPTLGRCITRDASRTPDPVLGGTGAPLVTARLSLF